MSRHDCSTCHHFNQFTPQCHPCYGCWAPEYREWEPSKWPRDSDRNPKGGDGTAPSQDESAGRNGIAQTQSETPND